MIAKLAVISVLAFLALTAATHPAHARKTRKPVSHNKAAARKRNVARASVRAEAMERITQRLGSRMSHFENAAALVPFFELLNQARLTGNPVHILQFGDSHTASDDWVDAMRIELQSRYGAGGPGFTLAGHPFRGYRRFDVSGTSSEGWNTEGTVMNPGDGREGLSGISITANSSGEAVTLRTSGDSLEIHYLQQPLGGDFELFVDGQSQGAISTRGELGAGIYSYQPSSGEHDYRLVTLSSSPVRLFGWASQQRTGITFETLGINGAQASLIRNWDNAIWQQEVASRQPALIVLEYGTNEAYSPKLVADEYAADLEEVVARVRSAAPLASILMIGPPDCGNARRLANLDEVIGIQRRIARENRVAFWNWRQIMGGRHSVVQWVRAGLGQPDYVHLTGAGYRLIGKTLVDELEAEHSLYLAARPRQSALQPSDL